MLELIFKLKILSNYHVSAGYGKGFRLDSALLTEDGKNGAPVIRGSTLAGLLLDSARRMLELPPLAKHHDKEKVLERIFGSPRQIKRWSISSAYPDEEFFEEKEIVQRVRIDPRTRRAEKHKLFSQEEGKAGQVFVFSATCLHNDPSVLDEAALITAVARFTRQLGRSRRRGLGECEIHLKDHTCEKFLLEHFKKAWLEDKKCTPVYTTERSIYPEIDYARFFHEKKLRFRLIIRLDEPLLIANRAMAGNWFSTRSFIPGSTIRGALAALAASRCDLADKKTYRDFVELFFRGAITFPILYPAYLVEKKFIYPTIPSPLGLTTCIAVPFSENAGHGIYKAWETNKCRHCKQERMETINDYLPLKRIDDSSYIHSPRRSLEMHVRIHEKTQRASRGDLYGYNVLNAGQFSLGELYCADESTWQRFQEMTGILEQKLQILRLGKARQRGYGKVSAWFERLEEFPDSFVQLPLHKLNEKEPISITLLTDTIIANPWGQQADGFSEDWLIRELNLGPIEILYSHARTRIVDNYNATTGLPCWRDKALAAGSMALIRLNERPNNWMEIMRKLENTGIGLRRNEGFGRIAFNHPVYEMFQEITSSAIEIPDPLLPEGYGIPEHYYRYRVWERNLDEHPLPDSLKSIKKGKHKYFTALARWLYSYSDLPINELMKYLDTEKTQFALGQPQQDLIKIIGENEYGSRSKDNFYLKEAKKEINDIKKILQELSTLDCSFHKRGVEKLVDWLAGLVREKEGV